MNKLKGVPPIKTILTILRSPQLTMVAFMFSVVNVFLTPVDDDAASWKAVGLLVFAGLFLIMDIVQASKSAAAKVSTNDR